MGDLLKLLFLPTIVYTVKKELANFLGKGV